MRPNGHLSYLDALFAMLVETKQGLWHAMAPISVDGSLFERTARLSNRLSPEALNKVLGDIHARVPMPTPDEQRALQLENAKVDAEQWSAIRDMKASTMADRQKLVARVETQIAADKAAVIEADNAAKQAQGRLDAIQRGETVEGGLGKPVDFAAILKLDGWTEADLRHARLLASIPEERQREFRELFHRLMQYTDRHRRMSRPLSAAARHGAGSGSSGCTAAPGRGSACCRRIGSIQPRHG